MGLGRWNNHKPLEDRWIPNSKALEHLLNTPLSATDESMYVRDTIDKGNWNLNKISYVLPQDLRNLITSTPIPQQSSIMDKII